MLPSFARIAGLHPEKLTSATLFWTRKMYDWYLATDPRFPQTPTSTPRYQISNPNPTSKPIIIDSADFITSPPLRAQLARELGMDPDRVLSTWEAASDELKKSWHPVQEIMTRTLAGSTGFVTEKTNIDGEGFEKWTEEFGEDGAVLIQRLVEAEMEDWTYLSERKWRVKPSSEAS
jgi:hypothetical protein